MNRQVLVTAYSAGLGRGLTETFLPRGDSVYGVSRRGRRVGE